MIGIAGMWCRLAGELVQALAGVTRKSYSSSSDCCIEPSPKKMCKVDHDDSMMIRALTAVFGMENNGKKNKEKARQVVEKLGLVYIGQEEEEKSNDDEVAVAVEEVLSGLERHQLLHEAFKIFDEDGNGYIEAIELQRVLQRLGLDKGWDLSDIHNMLKVVDLNLDGKVDFTEFQLMMM